MSEPFFPGRSDSGNGIQTGSGVNVCRRCNGLKHMNSSALNLLKNQQAGVLASLRPNYVQSGGFVDNSV